MATLFDPQPQEFSYNPWHGCSRISAGCKNCFIYTIDSFHQKDTREIHKTKSFHLPVLTKNNTYKIPNGSIIWTCFSSDFLLQEADMWRDKVWEMIKKRKLCQFIFFTKRIARLKECLPNDWGKGYENVTIGCSIENQQMADRRLKIFVGSPIRHRWVVCAPLIGHIDLSEFLDSSRIEAVSVGGEGGLQPRVCNYEWVLSLREQAMNAGVNFYFHQTGTHFLKDSKIYKIPKRLQRIQAKKASLDVEFYPLYSRNYRVR